MSLWRRKRSLVLRLVILFPVAWFLVAQLERVERELEVRVRERQERLQDGAGAGAGGSAGPSTPVMGRRALQQQQHLQAAATSRQQHPGTKSKLSLPLHVVDGDVDRKVPLVSGGDTRPALPHHAAIAGPHNIYKCRSLEMCSPGDDGGATGGSRRSSTVSAVASLCVGGGSSLGTHDQGRQQHGGISDKTLTEIETFEALAQEYLHNKSG